MERLTEKIGNTNCVKGCGSNCKYGFQHCRTEDWENCKTIDDVIDKLAEYEYLDEQGRLIKLPCKVVDVVYVVTSPFNVFDDIEYDENTKEEVYEAYVSSTTFYKSGEQYRIYAKATNHFIGAYFRECDFGKTVFLTKSEAEAKLKELRGGENG